MEINVATAPVRLSICKLKRTTVLFIHCCCTAVPSKGWNICIQFSNKKKEGKPHSIRTKANANSTTLTIFFKCSLSAFLCLLSSSQTCHSNTPIGSSIGHRMRRGFIGKDPGGIGWIFRYRLTAFHKINQIRNTRRVFDGFAFPLSAIICSLILSVDTHAHTHTQF